jgi:chromosome segregation ATPase
MPERQTIEQLQKRYSKFRDEKITVQTRQAELQKRLLQLKEQAKKNFGTDDVDALCKKLETMKKENEQKRSQYQKDLDKIESELESVKTEFAKNEIDV